MFFKNKQIVFPLFLLFLHPQKKFPGPPITKERSRVAGTGYVRGFRSNNQSKVRLRLCTVLEQLLAANPQISEAQKNVSLLMQKIQKRVQMARVVFYKVCTANRWLLGLVRVPYRTFPQRKKHGASHFVGVDKGNQFNVALPHHPDSWWRPKSVCPSLCATFRILLSFFRRALDTKWLEFSTAAMYVLFLSGRVSPHTHQTMQCHIYCV